MSNDMFRCCINCTERSVGCHSTCERYLEAKEIADKQKAERDKIKRANNDYYEFYRDGVSNRNK